MIGSRRSGVEQNEADKTTRKKKLSVIRVELCILHWRRVRLDYHLINDIAIYYSLIIVAWVLFSSDGVGGWAKRLLGFICKNNCFLFNLHNIFVVMANHLVINCFGLLQPFFSLRLGFEKWKNIKDGAWEEKPKIFKIYFPDCPGRFSSWICANCGFLHH